MDRHPAAPLDGFSSYTFTASVGEGVQLRVADVTAGPFVPAMTVYGPDGARIDFQYGGSVAGSSFSAPASGTYRVVVYDYSTGYASAGDYRLYFDRGPGWRRRRRDGDTFLTGG